MRHSHPETRTSYTIPPDHEQEAREGQPKYTGHATRNQHAIRRVPGLYPVRPRPVTQHLHLECRRLPQGSRTHCQPSHGLVPSGLVLSHGSYWYVWPGAYATSQVKPLTETRHHPDHTSRKRCSSGIRPRPKSSPHKSACAQARIALPRVAHTNHWNR